MADAPENDPAAQELLAQVRDEGVIEASGRTIDARLAEAIVEAAPRDEGGLRHLRYVDFSGCTFEVCEFSDFVFGQASFVGAVFQAGAYFLTSRFLDYADFQGAEFKELANFSGARFAPDAVFAGAQFRGQVLFGGAKFDGTVLFTGAEFEGDARFYRVVVEGVADFEYATFLKARDLGPVVVREGVTFESAVFAEPVVFEASTPRLSCARARFNQGARLLVRAADISLDEAQVEADVVVNGIPPRVAERDDATFGAVVEEYEGRQARLVSLQRMNLGKLVLLNVDLSACRFAEAYELDELRILGAVRFAYTPRGWSFRRSPWRWSRRRAITEEHSWRARRESPPTWTVPPGARLPDWLEREDLTLNPTLIAPIYRALRKRLEDSKDEPGAGDFYYGEMEMRKLDKTKPRAERFIVWVYWIVSGYGLRASRALLALLVTILVFAVLLDAWGFPSQQSFLDALTFSAQSTTNLFRAPDEPLTTAGEWLNMGLRLLGPLFFGLALLSLRGRVKR